MKTIINMNRTINFLAICLASLTVLLPASLSADEIIIKNDSTLEIIISQPIPISKTKNGIFFVTNDTLRINKISRTAGKGETLIREPLKVKADTAIFDLWENTKFGKLEKPIFVCDSCKITWGTKSYVLEIRRASQGKAEVTQEPEAFKQDNDSTSLAGGHMCVLVVSSNNSEAINNKDVICRMPMAWVILGAILLLAIIIVILIISYAIKKKKESDIRTQKQLLKEITEYPRCNTGINDNSDGNIQERLKEYIDALRKVESEIGNNERSQSEMAQCKNTDGNTGTNDNSNDNFRKRLKECISALKGIMSNIGINENSDDNIPKRLKEYIDALEGIELKMETLEGFKTRIKEYLRRNCNIEIEDNNIEPLKTFISGLQEKAANMITLKELKRRINDLDKIEFVISKANDIEGVFTEFKTYLENQKQKPIDKETQNILDELVITWEKKEYADLIKKLAGDYKAAKELIYGNEPKKTFNEELESVKTDQTISKILCGKAPTSLKELCNIFVDYLPTYFDEAVDKLTNNQRIKLVGWAKKDLLEPMSGKNLDNLTSDDLRNQYTLLSNDELDKKCLDRINEKTGKKYDTYEALKADIEKPSADAPVKTLEDERKLQEYNQLSEYGEDAAKIKTKLMENGVQNKLGFDFETAKNKLKEFQTLSEQTKTDKAEDIRKAIENKAITDVKIEIDKINIDDKKKKLVQNEAVSGHIGIINNSNNPSDLSTALNMLVEEFAQQLSTMQEKIENANSRENELLGTIKSDYRSLFNDEELNAQKAKNAFNSFVTKVKDKTAKLNSEIKCKEAKLRDEQVKTSALNEDCILKTQQITEMYLEWISQIANTFDGIHTAINTTCLMPSSDISNRFRNFVIENDGYSVEAFKAELLAILGNNENKKDISFDDYQRIQSAIKSLIVNALGKNSWIHALTRMFLYIQQPKIAECFINAGVVTSSIERAFIITEQMLRVYGVSLECPSLFVDEFDNDKHDNRPLADIHNVIGTSLVTDLAKGRSNVLIDLHRAGYTIDGTPHKPIVSRYS